MTDETDRLWIDSMPEAYERFLGATMFRPFAIDLARRAAAHAPRRVLELAAGTGALTRELVAGGCPDVTATDLNDAMVDFGREKEPRATWRQADAMSLPFGDDEFDLIACQFGVMFFPDKPTAFAEVRRVLTPRGTLLFSTWGTVDTHDFATALVAGLERAFPEDAPTFVVAIPHGYADLDAVTADLAAGGLRCSSVEQVVYEGHATSAADLAAGFCTGTPVRAAIESRGNLQRSTAIIADEMEARLGPGPVTGNMTAFVVEATPG